MEINRHNFEAFLLDRLEGRLSEDDQQRLHEFLLLNPDCALEMMDGDPWKLEPEKLHYSGSGVLKKEFLKVASLLNDHNFDLFSIARMEGDLTNEQEESHRLMVEEDDQKAGQWREWQETRLLPEPVLLREKKQLYHRKGSGSRVLWLSVVSAAAAVALFIVLFRMGPMQPQQELTQELPPKSEVNLNPGIPDQAELKEAKATDIEAQTGQAKTEVPQIKPGNTGLFSVKKEHKGPAESKTKDLLVPRDDLAPRAVRISGNYIPTSSLTGAAVPDRIRRLEVPPVSIHLSSLSIAQLSELDLQEMLDSYTEERDFSLWTIADAGIRGINKIAGSDISLQESRDEEGEVSGFQLKSKRFSIRRPFEREE